MWCTWQKHFILFLSQNLPDVLAMISPVRASFSMDGMGNGAKCVCALWASRQNGLLMPWIFVAYALCTTLADHPDTQLIVLTILTLNYASCWLISWETVWCGFMVLVKFPSNANSFVTCACRFFPYIYIYSVLCCCYWY